MRIAIASDHAGYRLKEHLKDFLKRQGHEVEDFGTDSEEPVDYPQFCAAAARAVRDGRADRGIVVGGSGQGEQMVANKVRGVRAALANDVWTAMMSRQHNDANVVGIGGRVVAPAMAEAILMNWLNFEFDGGRHQRRIEQIAEIEREEAER